MLVHSPLGQSMRLRRVFDRFRMLLNLRVIDITSRDSPLWFEKMKPRAINKDQYFSKLNDISSEKIQTKLMMGS